MKRLNPSMYSDVRAALSEPQPVQASLLHLAGCREDQLSYESRRLEHGQFTAAMLNAWNTGKDGGAFKGNYKALFTAMEQAMPADQKPVMNALGVDSERFNTEPAFTVG